MITLEQIAAAHSKVKSGADFPAYIQDLKQMGVYFYTTYVFDGHTDFNDGSQYKLSSPAKYSYLTIADVVDGAFFKSELKAHQEGKSDYPSFCRTCATTGISHWEVSIQEMTCTYFDKNGNMILVEKIPG